MTMNFLKDNYKLKSIGIHQLDINLFKKRDKSLLFRKEKSKEEREEKKER